jgi:hypothetical protein
MAKRAIKEKEIIDLLQKEGFKEIKEAEKKQQWHKIASKRPTCLKAIAREKAKK